MNVKIWMLAATLGGFALAGAASAQVAEDAKKALTESAQAMNRLDSMTCKVKKTGTGAIKDIIDVDGTVKFWRPQGAKHPLVYVTGRIKNPGSQDRKVDVSYDGTNVRWLDWEKNTLFERPMSAAEGREDVEMSKQFLLPEFLTPSPFVAELSWPTVTKEGAEQVNGEMCDMIAALPAKDRRNLWAISVADRLPRRFEQGTVDAGGNPQGQIGWVTNLSEVKTGMKFTAKDFEIAKPVGFIEDRQNMAAAGAAPELGTKVGAVAPSFKVADMAGKEQSLEAYEGKAVVLQFFGTMFKASTGACAETQIISDSMQGKKVAFLGIACRELGENSAADFWKQNKFTYPLIAKGGDDIAKLYKVAGYPTVVVVGADRTVVGYFQEVPPQDVLENAIRGGLPR